MENKKLYIIGGNAYLEYANWILPLGFEITQTLEQADLVLGAGGEDWSSQYYGGSLETDHPYLSCNPRRDKMEWQEFQRAIQLGKPIVGVCRSSQIAPVLAGEAGRIVQHQENSYGRHKLENHDGVEIHCSSCHHNAQYPFDLPSEDYQIIGWTDGLVGKRWLDKNTLVDNDKVEVERCFYPKINFLALQDHPEFCFPPRTEQEERYIEYTQKQLVEFLLPQE